MRKLALKKVLKLTQKVALKLAQILAQKLALKKVLKLARLIEDLTEENSAIQTTRLSGSLGDPSKLTYVNVYFDEDSSNYPRQILALKCVNSLASQ